MLNKIVGRYTYGGTSYQDAILLLDWVFTDDTDTTTGNQFASGKITPVTLGLQTIYKGEVDESERHLFTGLLTDPFVGGSYRRDNISSFLQHRITTVWESIGKLIKDGNSFKPGYESKIQETILPTGVFSVNESSMGKVFDKLEALSSKFPDYTENEVRNIITSGRSLWKGVEAVIAVLPYSTTTTINGLLISTELCGRATSMKDVQLVSGSVAFNLIKQRLPNAALQSDKETLIKSKQFVVVPILNNSAIPTGFNSGICSSIQLMCPEAASSKYLAGKKYSTRLINKYLDRQLYCLSLCNDVTSSNSQYNTYGKLLNPTFSGETTLIDNFKSWCSVNRLMDIDDESVINALSFIEMAGSEYLNVQIQSKVYGCLDIPTICKVIKGVDGPSFWNKISPTDFSASMISNNTNQVTVEVSLGSDDQSKARFILPIKNDGNINLLCGIELLYLSVFMNDLLFNVDALYSMSQLLIAQNGMMATKCTIPSSCILYEAVGLFSIHDDILAYLGVLFNE